MIRPAFKDWKRSTEKLIEILGEQEEDKRDGVITQVDQLLNVREQLQEDIQTPFTEEEKVFGQEVLQLEQQLQGKLANFFKAIQRDIYVTQSKKTNMQSYVNPYRSLAQDGAYYDTKQ